MGDGELREAVRKVLPIGNDRAPGDRVIAFYIRMDELRALRALAAVPEDTADAILPLLNAGEGWKRVPVEPTEVMGAAWESIPDMKLGTAWAALLAAAPEEMQG